MAITFGRMSGWRRSTASAERRLGRLRWVTVGEVFLSKGNEMDLYLVFFSGVIVGGCVVWIAWVEDTLRDRNIGKADNRNDIDEEA